MAMTPGELKRLRLEAGMKQKELGDLIGVSNRTISNWEKGYNRIGLFYERMLREQFDPWGSTGTLVLSWS